MACLASRIPYGEEITAEKLAQVEAAEACLSGLGFRQVRVRHHGPLAGSKSSRKSLPGLWSRLRDVPWPPSSSASASRTWRSISKAFAAGA